jgi:hypothetical protein
MKQNQLYYYTSRKEQDVHYAKRICTYSDDFFMTAFFTLKACGTSTTVLVASGGLTPADCKVPAMSMVTIPVEVVDGSVPTSWRLGSGEEADRLQKDSVSMQQYRYLTIQQGSNFIPGGFNYMRFLFAHYPMTLRDQRQRFGQLHRWSGGVVPSRLPVGFPFRQGAPTFSGLAAGQSLGCLSPFCFGCSAGEKVVRSWDVGLWWVALVQLCVSLQKIFS